MWRIGDVAFIGEQLRAYQSRRPTSCAVASSGRYTKCACNIGMVNPLPSFRPHVIGYATALALRHSLAANRQSMTDDLFRAIAEAYCLRQIVERLVPVIVYATRF